MHKKMEEIQMSTTWMWVFEEFKAAVSVEYIINNTCCWRLHLVAPKLTHNTLRSTVDKEPWRIDLCSLLPHLRPLCLWLAASHLFWPPFLSTGHSSHLRTFIHTLSFIWIFHPHMFPLIPLKPSNLLSDCTSTEKPLLNLNAGQVRYAQLCNNTKSWSLFGRSPKGGNGNPFSIPAWKIPDRGAGSATVHRVMKTWTWLSNWAHTHTHTYLTLIVLKWYIQGGV